MASEPVFFELSWSILSTLCAANVFFGLLVISVTSFSPIACVPIVTSVAGAVANGLCYYAFYLTAPPNTNRAVASAFADILWGVQEAGLSFYSYVILSRILHDLQWRIFAGVFWFIMVAVVAVRILIALTRVRFIVTGDRGLQDTVNHLHMGYFPLMAVLECVSAYYLLTTFARAKADSLRRVTKTGLFGYLMRSTEVRLALLAVVGIMRTITYSFQVAAQSATNLPSQFDRFAYTLECLFPMIMYIDMMSSKIVYSNQHYNVSLGSNPDDNNPHNNLDDQPPSSSSRTSKPRRHMFPARGSGRGSGSGSGSGCKDDANAYPVASRIEHVVEVHGGRSEAAASASGSAPTESQERIMVRDESFGVGIGMAASDIDLDALHPDHVGIAITKTVEFGVEVGTRPSPPLPSPLPLARRRSRGSLSSFA